MPDIDSLVVGLFGAPEQGPGGDGCREIQAEVFDNRYEKFFNILTSIFAMLVNKLNTSRKWGLRMPTQRAVVKIR